MKNRTFLLGVCLLLFAGYVNALQNSVGYRLPGTRIMFVAQITVPEDLKLVRDDGSVVGNEVCVGDRFAFQKNIAEGEYWQDAGVVGDPPVHWSSLNVSDLVNSLNAGDQSSQAYRELVATQTYQMNPGTGGICMRALNLTLGANSPPIPGLDRVYMGGVTCYLKDRRVDASGASQVGNFYKADYPGTISFDAVFDLDCLYYYTTEKGDVGALSPARVGICGETSNITPIEANDTAAGDYSNYRVGTITFSKTIKVVDSETPNVEMTVVGGDSLKTGEPNTLKVLIRNTGNEDVSVTDLGSKADHRFIACDMPVIKPGEEAECLLSVTPQQGSGVDVEFSYTCQMCGKSVTKTAVKSLVDSSVIRPASSAQAYSVDVTGGCTNQYYSCDYPDKGGTFYAGYSCFNTEDKFFSPANGRFDLKYALPEASSQEITSVSLNLFAQKVNEPQNILLYARDKDWATVSCAPEGDICLKPYCKECADIYESGLTSPPYTLKVDGTGTKSFDVTSIVKAAYAAGKTYVLFTVGGAEGLWARDGQASCNKVGEWAKKDVEFAGRGASEPYLEIVYKPKEPPYVPCTSEKECVFKRGYDAACIDGKCVKPDGGVCANNGDCTARLGPGWECWTSYFNFKGKNVCFPQGCFNPAEDDAHRGVRGNCWQGYDCGSGQSCHHIFGDDSDGKQCCCPS